MFYIDSSRVRRQPRPATREAEPELPPQDTASRARYPCRRTTERPRPPAGFGRKSWAGGSRVTARRSPPARGLLQSGDDRVNREQKAAVVDEVADQIKGADTIFAIDYRGISVKQAMDLRRQLSEAGAKFQIVKNRLTVRAADKAGAEDLKQLLEGPTAFAFVAGDPAVPAKAVATFRRQSGLLEFKGGTMAGEFLTAEQLDAIARLPARDALNAQFVGVLASPITGLVRGLGALISGLAIQL